MVCACAQYLVLSHICKSRARPFQWHFQIFVANFPCTKRNRSKNIFVHVELNKGWLDGVHVCVCVCNSAMWITFFGIFMWLMPYFIKPHSPEIDRCLIINLKINTKILTLHITCENSGAIFMQLNTIITHHIVCSVTWCFLFWVESVIYTVG